jgi:alkylation response protein AidB-like acyl-CoA dehydrogenase
VAVDYSSQLASIVLHLSCVPGIERLRALRGDAMLDDDLVSVVMTEAAKFSALVLAPLNPIVDRAGCRLEDGRVRLTPSHLAAWAAFREGGWTGIDFSEEHGGQGLPTVIGIAAQELFDRGCVAFGMAPGAARAAAKLIASHADKTTQAQWLPRLAAGEWGTTICMSEPDAGSDVGRARTRAWRTEEGAWRVEGEKIWISFGDHPLTAKIGHIVLARTNPNQPGGRGLSLFLVAADNAGDRNGVVIRRLEEKLGLHGSPTCAVGFEASAAVLIGDEGRGLAQLFRMIVAMRLQVGAQGLGLATAAYQAARDYAGERRQGGPPEMRATPIADHADVQRMLLDMASRIETLRGLVYAVAVAASLTESESDSTAKADASALLGWLLPIVKNSAAQTAFEISAEAIMVLGGAGYSAEWPVEQYLRDSRILAIYEGTTGMQAIDLVKRRLLAVDGGYETFVVAARSEQNHLTAADSAILSEALHALDEAVHWLRKPGRERAEIEAAATPMLLLAAAVAHGWIAARLVRMNGDQTGAARLVACGRYALSRLGDETPSLARAVRSAGERVRGFARVIL